MRLLRLNDENPFTGWHMLSVVILFFGTIIAVNLVMAFAATGTFPGLVVENSYVASQHYDELLAKARAQDKHGWQPTLTAEGGTLHFALADVEGQPVSNLLVGTHVGRPSTTREDRSIAFTAAATDGVYTALEPLPPGLWEVDLEATRLGETVFRQTQEIFVKPQEQGP
jgi:nitrogen fixation protein FixH